MNKKIVLLLSACLLIASVQAATCPDGQFDNGSGKCLQCPQYCTKCTDINTCTECQASAKSYQNICVSQCPSQSKDSASGSGCDLLCQNDGEYPEYEQTQFKCKKVDTDSAPYCIQQLQYLQTDKVGFSFQILYPTDATNLNLKVLFFNTPSICYTYDLHIGTDIISPLSTPKNVNGALEILYQYPIKKMDKATNTDCSDDKCTFTQKLSWKGYLQYTYTFEVKIQNSAVILNDNISISGSGSNTSPVCVGCQIPKELQLSATLQISCDKTTSCSDSGNIKATAGELVTVTQVLDSGYKQNEIKPFSLSLLIKDDSGASLGTFEIKNYQSDSTTKGQITYKFSTIGFKSGTLIVVSKIDNVIFGRRQLASNLRSLDQIQGTKYPYQEIKVEIQNDSISSSAAIGLIVGIVVACVAAVMSFFVLIIYMYKRRKIQKLQEKVSVSNQINEESIQHMNNIQNAKQLHQQNQIQNQVTDNKSAIFIQN
ncbi:transmembrane protein, putative (macronuclear) [Tetrahymena thermophila SB210]|uniref:Transmembrane protein, putative n=1 Tax=Tetrahymena thermophila (strain SB210) TaxID=312017 RepID=I7M9E6_TETTS|nr:transmembrane protein, putative [Tetrahymena thermophila SB210]EAS01440.1 transmembrane protein, putative [Tetrahymena thermophila SB210]|eukprot:XP_001021686.1 transmembrane protein, putative [Tetrahymena thermophila SB210]